MKYLSFKLTNPLQKFDFLTLFYTYIHKIIFHKS